MILAIDIGGTKTLLALYAENNQAWQPQKQQKYNSHAYDNISDILVDFCDNYQQVTQVCVGVAGPVHDNFCQITNLSWHISAQEITATTGINKVTLLNDLEATAWGVNALDFNDLININPHSTPKAGHVAILSAGTGLGEAILIRDVAHTIVVPSEGGHTDFAPQNTEQDALLCFLRQKYQGHVSYERLISGEGLYNIYQFLQQQGHIAETETIATQIKQTNPASVIGQAGIAKTDKLSQAAVRLFCQIYAAEAANLALKCLPYGGIILAGGITPKLLPVINSEVFLNAFTDKGRYKAALSQLPIYICQDENMVLLGAFAYAKNH